MFSISFFTFGRTFSLLPFCLSLFFLSFRGDGKTGGRASTRALLLIMSAAVDTLIGRVKRDVVVGAASAAAATDAADAALLRSALGRFAVTKHSWRGRYRRLLAVTPEALVTQHPDTLAVTNVWRYSLATSPTATTNSTNNANGGGSNGGIGVGGGVDAALLFEAGDVESVSVGKAAPPGCETGDLELTLSVRSDSKVKKKEGERKRETNRKEGRKKATPSKKRCGGVFSLSRPTTDSHGFSRPPPAPTPPQHPPKKTHSPSTSKSNCRAASAPSSSRRSTPP